MDRQEKNSTDQDVELICGFLNDLLGFTYGVKKKYLIEARLTKRLNELNINSYQAYLSLLRNDRNELNHFFDLLTTNVTSFFREDNQFQILQREILPVLIEKRRDIRKLHCWSAGCSSGEEAYSLAIILKEALGDFYDFRILASDISIKKLEEGMAGVYHEERLREVSLQFKEKYFQPLSSGKGTFRVIPELRKHIIFRKINLNQDFEIPSSIKFDLIFCRNVFIYLGKEPRERALNGFYFNLKEDGYLFVGQSEPISTFGDPRWLSVKNCIYRKQ